MVEAEGAGTAGENAQQDAQRRQSVSWERGTERRHQGQPKAQVEKKRGRPTAAPTKGIRRRADEARKITGSEGATRCAKGKRRSEILADEDGVGRRKWRTGGNPPREDRQRQTKEGGAKRKEEKLEEGSGTPGHPKKAWNREKKCRSRAAQGPQQEGNSDRSEVQEFQARESEDLRSTQADTKQARRRAGNSK